MGGARARGAQHEIVVAEPGERPGFRSAHRQRQRVGRRGDDLVADIGKGDQAVEQVIAIRAPADDMEVKIDFGGGEGGDRRARRRGLRQPPRSAGLAGAAGFGDAGAAEAGVEGGPSPFSSLASIGAMSSCSGPNCSARRH
jgi:hypothetical protein